jgi:hypothetical protein
VNLRDRYYEGKCMLMVYDSFGCFRDELALRLMGKLPKTYSSRGREEYPYGSDQVNAQDLKILTSQLTLPI